MKKENLYYFYNKYIKAINLTELFLKPDSLRVK